MGLPLRWIEKFDLFLFDLDGLLVDTEKLHYKAYQVLCRRYGYEMPWDFQEYLQVAHSSANGLKKALYPQIQQKGMEWDFFYSEKKEIYLDVLNPKELSLMTGVESLIKELAELRIKRCVVTHSSKEQVDTIKHCLPILKTIPVWITREDYEAPKPAPDAYLKAIELLADPGDRIIGFEDSFRGFCALQQTQAMPILICNPSHPQLKEKELEDVIHYPSFDKIQDSFNPFKSR